MSTTERLAEALAAANRIVAFTGAGISTESGIPDFRGPQGLWTKIDPSEFTIQNYMANAEHRRRVWRMRIERGEQRFEPNAGHRAIAELERIAKLECVVTQNVDGLHQDAGNTTVLELHGSPREVLCTGCRSRWPADEVLARVRGGEEDPSCEMCGGILKSATISFGEALPVGVLEEAYRRAQACDLCLVVGSSLVVYPAADVPMQAVRSGARLAIVNAEATPMDSFADPVVIGAAGEVLSRALELVRHARA